MMRPSVRWLRTKHQTAKIMYWLPCIYSFVPFQYFIGLHILHFAYKDQPEFPLCTADFTVHIRASQLNIVNLSEGSGHQKVGTVTFVTSDQPSGAHIHSSLESTYETGGSTDVPLKDYLARPVLIDSFEWGVNSDFIRELNVWRQFLHDANVRKRIEGFRHVRGHLKIRIVITGNPMLYGRAIACYEPFALRSVFPFGNPLTAVTKMVASQMPHVYLDAATSGGGEMTLPFFSPYTWLDLTGNDTVDDIGLLRIFNMTDLKHANSSVGAVGIRVFAWMDDAEICTPTEVDFDSYDLQNDMDEFKTGLISKPASAVAKAAGWLSHVPVISPYALATQTAANTIGNIASIFGFSRPQIIDNVTKVSSQRYGELATTNTHESIARIAMDAKSQLTVDPRTVGLDGADEMALTYMVQREAYLTEAMWGENISEGTVLAEFGVSPMFHRADSQTSPWRNSMPMCSAVGCMFNYWRGKMVFKFSIVASSFHRGKLRFIYDPAGGLGTASYNSVYSRIIDIEETRDFEIPIEWHASVPWLRVAPTSYGTIDDQGYKLATYGIDPNSQNGRLRVEVMNPLTSPDPTLSQTISVLCSVRGGDDLEFAFPSDMDELEITFRSSDPTEQPQNALIEADESSASPPIGGDSIEPIGNVSSPIKDHLSHVFMGESIQSCRALLKRYRVIRGNQTLTQLGTYTSIEARRIATTIATTTIDEFLTNMYVGWRGSRRVRYISDARYPVGLYPIHDGTTVKVPDGNTGIHFNLGGSEIEIPFYSNKRFAFARTSPGWTADNDTDPLTPNRTRVGYVNVTSNPIRGTTYMAAGEDYALFFLLGLPPFYKY